MTIFDWVNQIQYGKKSWNTFSEEEQKKFSPFIVNRFLSMDEEFIEVVNIFQKYAIGTLEPREVYKWYCEVLPKGKRYNKYIKGKKEKKYDNLLIETLKQHFEISKSECIEYMDLLPKDELKSVLRLYGINEKEIKKLIK